MCWIGGSFVFNSLRGESKGIKQEAEGRSGASSDGESEVRRSVVEVAALEWLESKGSTILHGPEIAAGMPFAERADPDFRDVVLRFREALDSYAGSKRC
jgi:hypothetical protein